MRKKNRKENRRVRTIKMILIMIIIALSVSLVSIYVYAFNLEGAATKPRPQPVIPTPSPTPTPSPSPNPTTPSTGPGSTSSSSSSSTSSSTPSSSTETPTTDETEQTPDSSSDSSTPSVNVPPPKVWSYKNLTIRETASGNAFESLEQVREFVEGEIFSDTAGATSAKTLMLSTDTKKKSSDPAIQGIKVELVDASGNIYGTAYTDAQGNYTVKVEGLKAGEKKDLFIRFTYGGMPENSNDAMQVKNALKYNAQDYGALQVGTNGSSCVRTIERTALDTKNEIMIVLDYSVSMTTNNRFKNIQASAKKLVDQIFESNSNISIGLVMFSPKAYLVTKPTDIIDNVKDTIDKFGVNGEDITYNGKSIKIEGRNKHWRCYSKSK